MRGPAPPRRRLLAGAAALALLVTAGCGGTGSTPAFNHADLTFTQNLLQHHRQALEMASVAGTRAGDRQLQQLAARIMAAAEPEIQMMAGWLTSAGRPSAPAGAPAAGPMPGMATNTEMQRLRGLSGVHFDRMFARMMIVHHNGGIRMAKQEQAEGASRRAKALAATVEKTQAAEIGQLEAILDRL